MTELTHAPPTAHGPRASARWIGLLAFVGSLALTLPGLGLDHYGFDADEGEYFEAAKLHMEWLGNWDQPGSFDEEVLQHHFPWKPTFGVIHPALSRLVSGMSWALFHGQLDADPIWSARLPSAVAYALIAALLCVFTTRRLGAPAGLLCLGLYWINIRYFGHAHIAKTDLILCALWVAGTLLLTRLPPQGSWAINSATAFLAGLALATKLPAILLILTLFTWSILRQGRVRLNTLIPFLLLPVPIFFALTPAAWHDPWGFTSEFIEGFTSREKIVRIPTLFFDQVYEHRMPWYAPTVHGLVTTPPLIVIGALWFALIGLWSWRGRILQGFLEFLRGPGSLFTAAALGTLAAVSLPSVPSHDVDRLFLPLQPFLVLFATGGIWQALQRIPRPGARWAIALVLWAPAAVEAWRQNPYQMAYFNGFLGGSSGAEARGMDVVYSKAEINQRVLDALNEHLRPNESLFSNFVHRDLWAHQQAGRLRPDIRLVDQGKGDAILIYARRGWMIGPEERLYRRRPEPLWSLTHRGVDLVLLYRLEDVAKGRKQR